MTDFTATGVIQYDTITYSGVYQLTAAGAQGGYGVFSTGGQGAMVSGDVYLSAGTVLEIVVGGFGGSGNLGGGGGGGGSFIIETNNGSTAVDTILAVAGGGGGGGGGYTVGGLHGGSLAAPGHDAGTAPSGGNGTGNGNHGYGGVNGAGGSGGFFGGGGGGFTGGVGGGAAMNEPSTGSSGSTAGTTFAGGAFGRIPYQTTTGIGGTGGSGGFGGGGGAGYNGGGGGGGYGGGGGGGYGGNSGGGGGGSYLDASLTGTSEQAGVKTFNGDVSVISLTNFGETGTIQYDTITASGTYNITADGAQGGQGSGGNGGGLGAAVSGDIYLAAGTVLELVTGAEGGAAINAGGGGGGGSFVFETYNGTSTVDILLAAAGGGGGGGYAGGAGAAGRAAVGGGNGGGDNPGQGGAGGAAGDGGGFNGGTTGAGGGGGGGGYTGGAGGSTGGGGSGGAGLTLGTGFTGGAGRASDGSGGGFGGGGGGGDFGGGGGGGYGGGGGGGSGGGGGGGGGSYLAADITHGTEQSLVETGNGDINVIAVVPCFVRGTRIRTTRGEIAVEHLAVGDRIIMARPRGPATRSVIWIGQRDVDITHHPEPAAVWPVLVRPGAFGPGLPARDLWLSPGHAVFVEGVLIAVGKLLNGVTIVQIPSDRVEYFHIELDLHDVVLAEGLPCESYLDTGNRHGFANAGAFLELHPDFAPKHWAETCVALVEQGAKLREVKMVLLDHARAQGHRLTAAADIHMLVDGTRVAPISLRKNRFMFILPPGAERLRLQSSTFVPLHADPASSDARRLGLCVGRLQIDGDDIPLDAPEVFGTGWHTLEQPESGPQRWTTHEVPMPKGAQTILIDLAARGYYWEMPATGAMATARAA